MHFVLIIAWMVPQGTTPMPPEIFKTEFSSLEMCRGAATFSMELIQKLPTKDGVKFMIRCVPAEESPEPEKDQGI